MRTSRPRRRRVGPSRPRRPTWRPRPGPMPRSPDRNTPDTDMPGRAGSRPDLDTVPPIASLIAGSRETPDGAAVVTPALSLDDHVRRRRRGPDGYPRRG